MEKFSWIRGVIALLVVLIVALFVAVLPPQVGPNKNPLFYTPFDGKMPEIGLPLGVMIENELAARPFQQGLSKADIIYEAPTEGNITRFLALFAPGKYPEKMGPIRSARTYFLDWMHEYKGVYVHVGGNPDALARLRKEKIFDADQFTYDKYFWRENVRRTALEHTMFTSGEKINELIKAQGWIVEDEKLDIGILGYLDIKNWRSDKLGQIANEILIDFGSPTYLIQYTYDPERKIYLRSQAKKPHVDAANKEQLFAKTVVVQRVKSWSNRDSEGSISIKTIDKGKATIFYEGRAIDGTWRKKDLDAPTEFFDDEGKKFSFQQGPVWIETLPQYNSFKY